MKWIVNMKKESGMLDIDYFQCSGCLAHSRALAASCPVCGVPLDLKMAECRITMRIDEIHRIRAVDSTEKTW